MTKLPSRASVPTLSTYPTSASSFLRLSSSKTYSPRRPPGILKFGTPDMEFSPPSGPPPPKLPAGWAARWNEQYSEWFYVNIHTKQSQWEKPTEPVYPATGTEDSPPGPPPGYNPATAQPVSDSKTGASRLSSNNPYGQATSPGGGSFPTAAAPAPQNDISEDERIARELQAEEDARGAANANRSANRGASDSYYQQQSAPQQTSGGFNQSLPPRPDGKSKGFLGKIFGKSSSSSQGQPQYGGYQRPQGYGAPQPVPYGAYPQQQPYPGYGYPPAAYGGGYGGGYGGYGPPPRRSGGMGAGGAAALGVGGGLLGGVLLADALDDDGGGSDGGDDGGGDDGGGD